MSAPHTRQLRRHTCGLQNVGNTCYLNSATQCLSNVRPLRDLLLFFNNNSTSSSDDGGENNKNENSATNGGDEAHTSFLRHILVDKWHQWGQYGAPRTRREQMHRERLKMVLLFQSCIDLMWHTQQSATNIKKFVSQFWGLYPRYGGYTQQDSMEFIRIVLDNMHEELKSVRNRVRRPKQALSLTSVATATSGDGGGASVSSAAPDADCNGDGVNGHTSDDDVDDSGDDDGGSEHTDNSTATVAAKSDVGDANHHDDDGEEEEEITENIPRRMEDIVSMDPELAVDDDDEFNGYNGPLKQFLLQLHDRNLRSDARSIMEKASQRNQQQQQHGSTSAKRKLVNGDTVKSCSQNADIESVLDDESLSSSDKFDQLVQVLSHRRRREPMSEISRIFGGLLLSEVQCKMCNNVSQTVDSFFDLSMSIPDMRTRQRLAHKESQREMIQSGGPAQVQKMKNFMCNAFYSTKSHLFGCFETLLSAFVDTSDVMSLSSCTMSEVFDNFFMEDLLTGANKYRCEHCRSLQNGIKRFSLLHMPRVLVVHLKRFGYHSLFASKISTHVSFDEYLTVPRRYMKDYTNSNGSGGSSKQHMNAESTTEVMTDMMGANDTEYRVLNENTASVNYGAVGSAETLSSTSSNCHAHCGYNGAAVDGYSSCGGNDGGGDDEMNNRHHSEIAHKYRLRSIVVHSGNYQLGGHYISYVRGDGDQWFLCNDSTITAVDFATVRKCQAYVLFYERQDERGEQD